MRLWHGEADAWCRSAWAALSPQPSRLSCRVHFRRRHYLVFTASAPAGRDERVRAPESHGASSAADGALAEQVVGQDQAIIASPTGTARMPTHGRGGPWSRPRPRCRRCRPCASDQDRAGRLDREAHDDVLTGRDAAEHAAGVVRQEQAGRRCLYGSRRRCPRRSSTAPNRRRFDALDALMLIIAWRDRYRACRRPARRARPARRRRRPRSPRRRDEPRLRTSISRLPSAPRRGIGHQNGLSSTSFQFHWRGDAVLADLDQGAFDADAGAPGSCGRSRRRRRASRSRRARPAAAAVVADAVLALVGEVGVTRPELVLMAP